MATRKSKANDAAVGALLAENALLWSMANIVLPRNIKWNFTGERAWQVPLFLDPNPNLVVRKSAQVGMSTTAICRVLHFLHHHAAHAMYTLPRRDDVVDFVNIYLDPIVAASPNLYQAKDVANLGSLPLKKLDNVRAKRFLVPGQGASLIIFMESSVEPRMIPVDMLINDEVDRSDINNIEIFSGRTQDSLHKIRYIFSTPSIDGAGVDLYFRNSTQNYWHVKCPKCNHWNKIDWNTNFQEPSLTKGAHLGCFRCHEELTPEMIVAGQWVSLGRTGEEVASGYQLSNLMMPFSRPIGRIYEEFLNTRSIKNFFNLVLGLPYVSAIGSMTEEMFKAKAFVEPYRAEMAKVSQNQYFIGVDQGKDLHVVVGRADGQKLKIIYAERIPFQREGGFGEVSKMIDRYDAVSLFDSEPNKHSVRAVQEAKPQGKVWSAKYGSYNEIFNFSKDENGRNSGLVFISRTEAFDELRDAVARGQIRLWSPPEHFDPAAWEVVQHCCNIKRDEVVTQRLGVEETRAIWKQTSGPDHFAHALLFCFMAWRYLGRGGFKIAGIGTSSEDEESAIRMVRQMEAEAITAALEYERQQQSGEEWVEGEGSEEKDRRQIGRKIRIA